MEETNQIGLKRNWKDEVHGSEGMSRPPKKVKRTINHPQIEDQQELLASPAHPNEALQL